MKRTYILKITVIIIATLQFTEARGQKLPPDTVFVKKSISNSEFKIDTFLIPGGQSKTHLLLGTTFLPYTEKMIGLLNKGLSPISLEVIKGCNNSSEPPDYKNYPKFEKVKRDSNILTIEVSVASNCCNDFLGEAEVIGKETLNLVYTAYGDFCSCNCCFTLRYKFDTTFEKNYQTLKLVTINGDNKSLIEIPLK